MFVVFLRNISHSLCHNILKHVLHILFGGTKHGKNVKTGLQYALDLLLGALTLCNFYLDIIRTLHLCCLLISFHPHHCGVFNVRGGHGSVYISKVSHFTFVWLVSKNLGHG
jgi:hypothetical protein